MPKRVKRRRQITNNQVKDVDAASAQEEGWEEYYDLIFPDDELAKEQQKSLKILEMAHLWKQQQAAEWVIN